MFPDRVAVFRGQTGIRDRHTKSRQTGKGSPLPACRLCFYDSVGARPKRSIPVSKQLYTQDRRLCKAHDGDFVAVAAERRVPGAVGPEAAFLHGKIVPVGLLRVAGKCGSFPSFSKWWSSALAPAPRKVFEFFRFLENEIFISILQKHGRKFA